MDVRGLPEPDPEGRRSREILDRVADKWTMCVVGELRSGRRRFNELRRDIDGISQRMLAVTLRGLERDGLVSRTVYPSVPPRVDYALTDLGHTLVALVTAFLGWVDDQADEIEAARDRYDARSRSLEPLP